MSNGITPEEERRRQEQERRYQKAAEEKARAAWQRGLENEREAAEALKEEKKTHTGKRRVSFDSLRNQTHLYRDPSQISSASASSTDAGKPSDELLQRQQDQRHSHRQSISETGKRRQEALDKELQLKQKEIASLRAELEAIEAKEAEEKKLARKKQEHEAARAKHEAAWKEQKRHRQKAEEEALQAKEAEESVLARIRQEGEAARRKYHEALKRGLENERSSTSQAYSRKPEQGSYSPQPSSQQNQPAKQYPPSGQYPIKQDQHGHPTPHQRPSASSVPIGLSGLPAASLCTESSASEVPVGLSGLPAESLCSDGAPNISRYEDEDRGRYVYSNTYGSTKQVPPPHDHPHSALRQSWSTPPAPAWKVPTSALQIAKQTLVIPAVRSYHAGVQTPKEQWPLPPTLAHSEKEPEVPTPVESEKEKLERQLRQEKRNYEELTRRRAELEKKGRGNSASSVASWQTGCKSVWEDPTKVTSQDVAGHQPDTRQSRWERSTEGPKQESSVNRKDRSLSRTTTHTRYHKAQEYLNSSDEERKPKLSKAHARAKSLKLELSVGMNPPYVPPTPYWHPSPPPSLPPTPPQRSSAPGPAVAGPSTSASKYQEKYDHFKDTKTPYPPGSWWGDEREPYRLVQ